LTDENGNTEYIKHKDAQNLLGAKFKKADPKELRKLGLGNGVKIERIQKGSVLYNAGIKEGFIVVEVDNKPVKTAKDISKILKMKKGGILFSGLFYGFNLLNCSINRYTFNERRLTCVNSKSQNQLLIVKQPH